MAVIPEEEQKAWEKWAEKAIVLVARGPRTNGRCQEIGSDEKQPLSSSAEDDVGSPFIRNGEAQRPASR